MNSPVIMLEEKLPIQMGVMQYMSSTHFYGLHFFVFFLGRDAVFRELRVQKNEWGRRRSATHSNDSPTGAEIDLT